MDWAAAYNSGRSIQSIADEAGVSYGVARNRILRAGAVMRPSGVVPHVTPEQERERLRQKSSRQYHAWSPEEKRKRNWQNWLRVGYNLSVEQWDEMLVEQCGCCDICGKQMVGSKEPCIDHDHKTRMVRSLLCVRCNLVLAGVEDASFKAKAEAYLERHHV